MQAGSSRRPNGRSFAQGPARSLENIMEKASSKNASGALSQYAELRSQNPGMQIQALLRSTTHSPLEFYSALVQSAVRAGQPEVVAQLLEDMISANIERTLSFYESAMKLLAGKKHYREALSVYDRLKADGLKASPVTLSCLINFAVELGELDRAIEFFEQLSSTSTPSIRAYMMALRVYSKRQDWSKSLEIFRSMQERGVAIDTLILNSVLSTGASSGKMDATAALLSEMADSKPDIIDVISYNTVLKGYAHQKDANKALKVLDSMIEHNVKPNSITFNTVMDAAVRSSQIEEAWTFVERMRQTGIRPDKYTCTILMKGLHEQSTPKQLSMVLDLIQSVLPQCDAALGSSLFRGLLQAAARLSNTTLLMHIFNQLQGQNVSPTATDLQLILVTLAEQYSSEHCATIWRHVLKTGGGSHQAAVTLFTTVMEELAKREKVEGMVCIFESLQTVLESSTQVGSAADSQKGLDSSSRLLQQCRTALIQAASRKQHVSPAFKRLLELAPEQGIALENPIKGS